MTTSEIRMTIIETLISDIVVLPDRKILRRDSAMKRAEELIALFNCTVGSIAGGGVSVYGQVARTR